LGSIEEGAQADIYLESEGDSREKAQDIQPAVVYPEGVITSKRIDAFRDELAEKMWVDYKKYLNNGGGNDLTGE
jgi:hypothetical protein